MLETSRIAFMYGQSVSQNSFILFVKETRNFLPMCSSKAVEGNSGFDISS